ncbi:MAG: class IV adenylate cyclase [Pirellulaceae bacterium]
MADSDKLIEVELKYACIEPEQFVTQIEKLGFRRVGAVEQIDEYWNHPTKDYAETDEAFRIRREDGLVALTYKGPKANTFAKSREEIELAFEANTSLDQVRRLLSALGFRAVASVTKHRKEYESPEHDGTKIVLDHVEQLGWFVEVERVCMPSESAAVEESLIALCRQINLNNPVRESYLELILRSDP